MKVCNVVWKHQLQFSHAVLVMGGFHVAMVILAIIGKCFADAGLADLLIELGMLGPSTVCSVLSGKHYNRGVRAHKAAMEALFRTLWQKLEVWLNEHDEEATTHTDFLILLNVLRKENFKPIMSKELLHFPGFMALHKTFYHFS